MKTTNNQINPIYTEETECQDCYKCLRQCPVKAIRIQDGHAQVIPELCIMCGKCVDLCPVGAKKYRNDVEKVEKLLSEDQDVYVSLAPSAFSEFEKIGIKRLITALKKAGFQGISETALGAELVNQQIADKYQSSDSKVGITSACPTVVKCISKYKSEYTDNILPVLSPLLAHCKYLKEQYGEGIKIVFIGPCIAKKSEADEHPNLLEQALTFEEARTLLSDKGINLQFVNPDNETRFDPKWAGDGAFYPIEGGSLRGLKKILPEARENMISSSGIDSTIEMFERLDDSNFEENVILELLACNGGCINGPMAGSNNQLSSAHTIIQDASQRKGHLPKSEELDIWHNYPKKAVEKRAYSSERINSTLREIGKYSESDELNCSSCGYDSCRDFARALLDGKAEKTMCISYMKQLAQKKTDALMNAIPAGVVMVNDELKIVDSNRKFAEICGHDAETVFEAKPGMEGALLDKISPFQDEFRRLFNQDTELIEKDTTVGDNVYHLSIFSIEKNRIAGGIIQDITDPAVEKTVIIKKARKVIENNLKTVQKIAYLLGENASETEIILNSIVENFSPENMEEIES